MDNTELARIAYDAYRDHTGGVSLATGQPIPEWPQLRPEIQAAWQASAEAVRLSRDTAWNDAYDQLLAKLQKAKAELTELRDVVSSPAYREALALLAGKDARDRRMKAIGAAEWLKEFAGDADGSIHITHAWLRDRAAKLQQEAEDGRND